MTPTAALELVYAAIDAANELRRADDKLPKDPDLKLAGEGGRLDSLSLATLILSIENRIEETSGEYVSLIDESADDIDAQFAGLATPQTLAAMICEKLG